MSETLLYPRILYVVSRHSSTINNLASILSKKLIPASSMLPGVVLDQTSVNELKDIIESEAGSLDTDAYMRTYFEINVLKSLEDYEWVVLDRPGGKLVAAPIRGYVYMRTTTSPVHHYIEFADPSINIPYANINTILMHRIRKAKNLSELPAAAADLINAHRPGSLRRTRSRAAKNIKLEPPVALREPESTKLTNSTVYGHVSAAELGQADQSSISHMANNIEGLPIFEAYYASIMPMQDYLQANVANLTEQYHGQADLAFSGNWHNGELVMVHAFRLTDNRGHGCWYVRGDLLAS